MAMKAQSLWRHVKEGFQNLLRNGWMSVAAISAVAVTLLLIGSLIAVLFNANKFASDVENDVSVRVYIDLAAEEEDVQNLEEEIESIEEVEAIEFSNRDQELEQIIGGYGDAFTLYEGDENPLRDVFIVNTALPEQTASVAGEIEELEYVSEVNYGGATADQLFELMDNLQIIGVIATAVLIIVAIFLISNTIRITILSRQREIEIMKLVGATNWFIRWPFIIEGALIGFIGAIIPVVIIAILYNTVFDRIMGFLSGTSFAILPPVPFLVYLSIGMILTGVIIGAVGSSMSIRKSLEV